MIFLAVAGPTPGRASRSFWDPVFRSTGPAAAAGAVLVAAEAGLAATAAREKIRASPSSMGSTLMLLRNRVIGSSLSMERPAPRQRPELRGAYRILEDGGLDRPGKLREPPREAAGR